MADLAPAHPPLPLGATPRALGRTEFRVWAPEATSVEVLIGAGRHPLDACDDGMFAGDAPARHGDDYLLLLDDDPLPDPCSRWQPEGLRGPSRVLDPGSFNWSGDRPGTSLEGLSLYELHVGAFTPEGTFAAAAGQLDALVNLGVSAVELMPVATFPGRRGWGYDGVLTWAPHEAYGGPDGLAGLVDACHTRGLAVFLDVVYNHIGPGSELVSAFGPYFTDRVDTPWGDAIDYTRRGVREWAVQNAEQWVRDYRIDGLRLDAVHAVHDETSDEHVLAELARRVRSARPATLVVSETGALDRRPLDDWGHDAIWLDALHHQLHVLLTGEREGYYAPFGAVDGLVEELTRPDAERFVVSAQNHDQVGNRAFGDRLAPADHRVALAVVLFAASTPLLFMGEEYDETRPFCFFTNHDDPAIAEATRAGRRREFAAFSTFAGEEIPDPQALETFRRSILARQPSEPLYRELLALRRALPRGLSVETDGHRLRLIRGDSVLDVDLAAKTVELRS